MAFQWTELSEKAAQLLAEGRLGITEIAKECAVTRQMLWYWRRDPEFMARVEERLEEIRAEVRRYGIAVVEQRLARVNDTWERLQKLVEARAIDMADAPGGDTGLMVRRLKKIGSGPLAETVEEYEVDTGLLSELREHEKQAAQELGQWISKADVVSAGKALQAPVVILPAKELHDLADQATTGPSDAVPGE